jgi:outer membrane protein assembly factor BamB
MSRLLAPLIVLGGAAFSMALPAIANDWPVFGYDAARSGFDSSEHTLSVANVAGLHEKWQVSLGSVGDSAPIFIQRVRVGNGYRSMLFETTMDGATVALEASSGRRIWRFSTSGPNITTAAPAADPSGASIYVSGVDGEVHKISASAGRELKAPGFPARVTWMPNTEKVSSALNIAGGYLYVTTSGYRGDATLYEGHIVGVRLSSGDSFVFSTLCSRYRELPRPGTCTQQRSGIWGRAGVVVDPDPTMQGRIYVATGDGDFNANSGGDDYGDSLLTLTPDFSTLLGTYTPAAFKWLESKDLDLGSTAPALLSQQPSSQTPWMLVQGGKDGVLRLLDRRALRGVGHELQTIRLPASLFSSPAVWTDPSANPWIFIGLYNQVDAYRLETSSSGASQLVSAWQWRAGRTRVGTSPVVANGVVFVAFDRAIVALDALNGTELWSSAEPFSNHTIGPVHWQSPIVVNGSVYCADQNGRLTAYSLSRLRKKA